MPLPGLSFSPTQQDPTQQTKASNPVQSAIQLLSYRLPQTVGASAIAPQQLLSGGGGQTSALGSQVGSAVANEWLRKLFMGGGDLGGAAPMSAPTGAMGMTGSNPFMNWMQQEQSLQSPAQAPARNQLPNIGFGEQGGGGSPETTRQTLPDVPTAPQAPTFGTGAGGRRITWGG